MIDEIRIRNYIRALINPYGKPFEGTAYELGLKIMKYIEGMEKANYPLGDCVGDCKSCWKTKLVNEPKVGEWIPCSERLPDKAGFYVVTKRQKSGEIQVALGSYRPLFNEWSGNGNFKDVLAWCELPQPYKGE